MCTGGDELRFLSNVSFVLICITDRIQNQPWFTTTYTTKHFRDKDISEQTLLLALTETQNEPLNILINKQAAIVQDNPIAFTSDLNHSVWLSYGDVNSVSLSDSSSLGIISFSNTSISQTQYHLHHTLRSSHTPHSCRDQTPVQSFWSQSSSVVH